MSNTPIRVNIISLSSHVSTRNFPYFLVRAQDLRTGGMCRFVLMRDSITTQNCLDSVFKTSVDQSKLFNALLKPSNVSILTSRFLRNPYEFGLSTDNSIPPEFRLRTIRELEVPAEKTIKFSLNRRM